MAWTDSRVFQYSAKWVLGGLSASNVVPTGMSSTGFLGDVCKFALYGSGITPDKTVATGVLSAYNGAASQWVAANEVTATGYTAGGFTIPATKAWAIDATAGPCFTSSGSTTWTITGTLTTSGGLFYDDAITAAGNFAAKQGVCYNYFGGSQSVTNGTFTIAWATAGSTADTIYNIST